MNEFLQLALAGLVAAGYVVIWRIDSRGRATDRIQQAARRNVAEYKRAIAKLKDDGGNLNQARHELNARYSEAIKTREELNSRYRETINRMRKHHGIPDEGQKDVA